MSQAAVSRLAGTDQSAAPPAFGFWVYLMTDCVVFATLFATFVVLRNNTFGGPAGSELFSLPYALALTLVLLTSSLTAGLALLAARRGHFKRLVQWLGVTLVLGLVFLSLELYEFVQLYQEGNSWRRSGFLSAFFTLVGTHGAHITAGLLWMGILMAQWWRKGLGRSGLKRITMLALFWHFLDIIWIFIFSIVYLMGVAAP